MTILQNDYRADETKEFHRLPLITVTWFMSEQEFSNTNIQFFIKIIV